MNPRRTIISAVAMLLVAGAAFGATVAQATTPLDGRGSRAQETALGDLVADSVRSAKGADIGLVPGAALNEVNIPEGPVTDTALVGALAYADGTVAVLSLKGAQIWQALERSVELYPKGNSAFLQVSGLQVRFDPKRPAGSRVTAVQVGGSALDPGRTYRVAMPSSLGLGSLGYFRIWGKDDILPSTPTKLSDTVVDYARGQGKIGYRPGERIIAKSGE